MALSIFKEEFSKKEVTNKLGDFFPVITGKKDANIAKGGEYPFFSCSQNISYTDNYSFNARAILLAGNGDFNVKIFNGKFEAYQRTYVLIPNNDEHFGYLYYAIKYFLNDITSGHRGSVIKFITKGQIEHFDIFMTSNKENLINRENGTVFGSINKTDISNLEVQVPSLREQIQIGLTLKAIDDKIENNKKINHHLAA